MVLHSISVWLLVFFVMLAIFGFDGALIDIWRITPRYTLASRLAAQILTLLSKKASLVI
jgi:hypothetical protein